VCRYSLFSSFLISNLLVSASLVSLAGTEGTEVVESSGFLHLSSDGSELSGGGEGDDGNVTGVLGSVLHGGGVDGVGDESLLGGTGTAGEEDQFLLVHVKSIHVPCELLLAGVGSAVIDRDSNRAGKCGGELGSLDLGEGETTSVSDLTGVLASLAGHNGAEGLSGSGESVLSSSISTVSASELLGSLVEVSVGSSLPVLTEMDVGNRVVVLDHCDLYIQSGKAFLAAVSLRFLRLSFWAAWSK